MIVSVGFVSAEDANQTDIDSLQASDMDAKSFADLNDTISKSGNVVGLTDNYQFNGSGDASIEICLTDDDTLTINGNNHVIDGNNEAGAFRFVNGNVVINNLTFRNCKGAAISIVDCVLTTNNVIFENNTDDECGAAVFAYCSDYYSNDDRFTDNYSPNGASVYLYRSRMQADNPVFVNKNPIGWSAIMGDTSEIAVLNGLFANMTSRYATALYNEKGKTYIKNTRFINLYANATAGAIGIKNSDVAIIENCEFLNVASAKNGGAIFADVNGNGFNPNGITLINQSSFESCGSDFGGAILQLGGKLSIVNSAFSDNFAFYHGGAIYTSNSTMVVAGSDFTKNDGLYDGYSNGGAMFIDDSYAEIEDTYFADNGAFCGGAIYAYDSYFDVSDSTFYRNGEAIHGVFAKEGSGYTNIILADKDKDTIDLDDTYYPYVVDVTGNQIVLNPIAIEGSVTDSSFDLRNFNAVTSVKNQGNMGSCWAFGANGAVESAFLIATNVTLDLSENNVQNSLLRYSIYGNPTMTEGGTIFMGLAYYLCWLGIVNAEYDSYDELGKISPIMFTPDCYHILDAVFIDTNDIVAIKNALIHNGALTAFVNGADKESGFFNAETNALYCNNASCGDHFITVVGWNDTFSKSNFIITPQGDGAWICKNSWGEDWGDGGYFYISYYDDVFRNRTAVGYIIKNTDVYDTLYQYDITSITDFNSYKVGTVNYTNIYQSVGDGLIAAVGTYFEGPGQEYVIYISVNDTLVHTQRGKSSYGGYQTIKLDRLVSVGEGENFSATVQSDEVPVVFNTRLYFKEATSYVSFGQSAMDLTKKGEMACLKVYTVNATGTTRDVKQIYTKDPIVISGLDDNEGWTVSIEENSKVIATTTVKDGSAAFGKVIPSGKYALAYSFNGTEIVNVLEVLPTIQVDSVVKSGYNSKLTVKARLIDSNGNPLKNIKVTAKFDGVSSIMQTDENGFVTYSVSGLKIANHTLSFANPVTGEESMTIVQVVSRFGPVSNIVMDYYDGSSFRVQIFGNDGNPVGKNQVVVIKLNKKTHNVKTNANGYAVLKIPSTVKPGSYKITATYAGQKISKTVKVKQILKSTNRVVKKSAKSLVLKATLKTSKNKAIKGKTVKFKVNGKIYKGKTNSKGIAKVTIKKSAIKKLKAGKKYAIKISYLKDTIKKTLTVKR